MPVDSQERPSGPGVTPVASFEELYAEHFDFTFRSLRYLGVPSPALEDAVQDLWLTVHRRLSDFEGRSSYRTWLFGIALNIARQLRGNQRRAPERTPVTEALPSQAPGPDRVQAGREALALVQRYLDTLAVERRVLFVSHLIEHLDAAECAELLGVEVAVIYPRVRDLRRGFQRWLAQQEQVPAQ